MVIGLPGGIDGCLAAYAAVEGSCGLGIGGLVTIIVVSVVAVAAFVWIFRETGRRD